MKHTLSAEQLASIKETDPQLWAELVVFNAGGNMKSFKVAVMAVGETEPAYNGLRFETKEQAYLWGADLLMRWMGAVSFTVEPSEDEVNRPEVKQ